MENPVNQDLPTWMTMTLLHSSPEGNVRLISRLGRSLALLAAGSTALTGGLGAATGDTEVRGGLPRSPEYDRTATAIHVLVQDAQGAPVTGLTAEDFRLVVDGEEQEIAEFAAFNEGAAPATTHLPENPATPEAADPDPVYVALFIDNQNLRTSDRNRVLRMLQTFVRSGFGPEVRFMVVAYDGQIEVVQPFTSEPAAVVDALRQLRSSEAALDEMDREREEIHRGIRRAQQNRHHSTASRRQVQNDLYNEILQFSRRQGAVVSETLAAMRQVFLSLTGLDGRTSVIYVSNGLPMALGAELMQRFTGLSTHSLQGSQTFARSRHRLYDTTASAASGQQITIHTVDATTTSGGDLELGEADSRLRATAAAVDRTNRQAPLKLLSEKTGGVAVLDTQLPDTAPLAPIRSALLTAYRIGYDPGPATSDTIHHLELALPGHPDHQLHYSSTLVNKGLETRVQSRVTSALFTEAEADPLAIELLAAPPVPATPDRWQAVIEVSLPVASVRMARQGDEFVGEVQHFVALMNLESGVTDTQRQTHTFRIPVAEYDERAGAAFPIYLRLLVEEGENRIVVGIIDRATLQTSIESLEVTAGK